MTQRKSQPPPPPTPGQGGDLEKTLVKSRKIPPTTGDVSLNQNVTNVGTTIETNNEQKDLAVCYRISPFCA